MSNKSSSPLGMTLLNFGLLCGLTYGVAPVAAAQSPVEIELDGEFLVVAMPLDETDAPTEVERGLGELSLTGNVERVFENGVRLRGRFAVRAQHDHPNRPGGLGGFGPFDDIVPFELSDVGAFSGQSLAGAIDDESDRISLETAYLQIDGGYGEVRLGRDLGVAARFYEGPKSVLSHARIDSTLLDPTGLSTVRTRHDLTGPSEKVSYASPRILGLRVGASLTPEADATGLDRRPNSGALGRDVRLKSAFELGANFNRKFKSQDLRVEGSLAWSTVNDEIGSNFQRDNDVDTVSTGLRFTKGDWTLGAAWLGSGGDTDFDDYQAWSVGAAKEFGKFSIAGSFAGSDAGDGLIANEAFELGGAYEFANGLKVSVAGVRNSLEIPSGAQESSGIVVEITRSFEIFRGGEN